jgi:hypothetical protein
LCEPECKWQALVWQLAAGAVERGAVSCAVLLQLVQEFRVLLLMGRKLVFPVQTAAVVRADITMEIQVEGSSSSSTSKHLASLMFP